MKILMFPEFSEASEHFTTQVALVLHVFLMRLTVLHKLVQFSKCSRTVFRNTFVNLTNPIQQMLFQCLSVAASYDKYGENALLNGNRYRKYY
jgi:hypothetical protein